MNSIDGRVLTADGLQPARIAIDADRVASVEPDSGAGDRIIIPGFIDLHCHGGGGADVMDAGDAVATIAATHAAHGTTAFLATTMTAPEGDIRAALGAVATHMAAPADDGAACLGVHLEGPFISRDKLGAQPDFVIEADIALIDEFNAIAPLRVVTCAPEADPDGAMTRHLAARGTRVQIGHSSCDYETAAACFAGGRHGVTHMFNAMSGLHHRAPGIAGAALAHADHAELIPDLLHVHPGAIRAAMRAIPGLYAVTDATAASGMPDGDYQLGTQTVRRCGNGVRLADGTLAGSCLTMMEAFANLVSIGLDVADAAARTSTIAADYLGLTDRGRIAGGAIADLVVLTPDLSLETVILRGRPVTG